MALLLAIHRLADDPKAYLSYYFETHVPLAKKLPGLIRYDVSVDTVINASGEPVAQLVAVLEFESRKAIEAALASDAGAEATADLPKFAKPGQIELQIFDTRPLFP